MGENAEKSLITSYFVLHSFYFLMRLSLYLCFWRAGQPNQPVVLSQAGGPFSDTFNLL
jgi:hypothetical protein